MVECYLMLRNEKDIHFAGWYTAITGGTRVTAKTIVSTANDHDLYIRWTEKGRRMIMKMQKNQYYTQYLQH